MEKINCRIINVNPGTPQEFINFGHSVDENGNKIRYSLRRERINRFLENNIDSYDISIFDAVTPKDFEVENDSVKIADKTFRTGEKSIFYIANVLSHVAIWSLDEDTLVLEDDLVFEDFKFEILRDQITEFKSVAGKNDILYLQLSTPWIEGAPEKMISYGSKISNNISLAEMDFSGTAAYFITKETKRNIMNLLNSGFPLFACDKLLGCLLRFLDGRYLVPTSKESMFNLDIETYWN